jgi:hypothetical protein
MWGYEEIGRSYGTATIYVYPSGLQRMSLEDLKNMIKEAEELLKNGDYVQACEKFYKVTEEIIKILAEIYAPNTLAEVRTRIENRENPWNTALLYRASAEISEKIDEDMAEIVRQGWRSGLNLHRDCFHEFFMTSHDITDAIGDVKKLFNLATKIIQDWDINRLSFATVNVREEQIVLSTPIQE